MPQGRGSIHCTQQKVASDCQIAALPEEPGCAQAIDSGALEPRQNLPKRLGYGHPYVGFEDGVAPASAWVVEGNLRPGRLTYGLTYGKASQTAIEAPKSSSKKPC